MSNADRASAGSDLFGDEESTLAACEATLQWLVPAVQDHAEQERVVIAETSDA